MKAEQLGYTNVKVYHEGMPAWSKRNYSVLSPKFLQEAFIKKDIPHVLLDVRPAKKAKKGFIKGAVTLPAGKVKSALKNFPPPKKKAPIIVYDAKGGKKAVKAAKTLVKAGHKKVRLLTGGVKAWEKGKYPLEKGTLATEIVYVPKPRPGEMSMDAFMEIADKTPSNILILDVRNRDEANAGVIKGAMLVPDEEILDRMSEIPKNKMIVCHCATGVRAEMAYHKLKGKGYNVKFLNANIFIEKDGSYEIEK
ncbi:MAG TPA: hypothetical protein DCO77_06395 [Nitrospiraceae bacterium]|nr:hypothetical protein [Nitrospiraceae bacterium]